MGLRFLKQNLQTVYEENMGKFDSLHRDQKPRTRNKSADTAINPEAGIINLLRQGFFALQLLPENSCAGKEVGKMWVIPNSGLFLTSSNSCH
mgnify:CR=1 FL=1